MSCDFCGHPTPHGCWTAEEAASCGNYSRAREAILKNQTTRDAVEEIIAARGKPPTREQIEEIERRELARLKAKYEPKQS